MAYQTAERNRTATLAAVGALHVGVIYALVVGLAGPAWLPLEDKPLVGEQIPLPKPPPARIEPAQPDRDPRTPQADQRDTRQIVDVFPAGFTRNEEKIPLPPIGGGLDEIAVDPLPPPLPPVESVPAKLARPLGKPGLWVTANDYPSSDLRAEHEGTTRFTLSIGADGKVQTCEVTLSSGFASLDKAACDTLRKRGRFTAATGTNGAAVPGTYSSAVQWKIPKD